MEIYLIFVVYFLGMFSTFFLGVYLGKKISKEIDTKFIKRG
jgi:putative Ca2+/H+ antiporter (TMEM165/GDT1 family)